MSHMSSGDRRWSLREKSWQWAPHHCAVGREETLNKCVGHSAPLQSSRVQFSEFMQCFIQTKLHINKQRDPCGAWIILAMWSPLEQIPVLKMSSLTEFSVQSIVRSGVIGDPQKEWSVWPVKNGMAAQVEKGHNGCTREPCISCHRSSCCAVIISSACMQPWESNVPVKSLGESLLGETVYKLSFLTKLKDGAHLQSLSVQSGAFLSLVNSCGMAPFGVKMVERERQMIGFCTLPSSFWSSRDVCFCHSFRLLNKNGEQNNKNRWLKRVPSALSSTSSLQLWFCSHEQMAPALGRCPFFSDYTGLFFCPPPLKQQQKIDNNWLHAHWPG